MKIDIWNKWVQTLYATNQKPEAILASILISDKLAFAYYYHTGRGFNEKYHLHYIASSVFFGELIQGFIPEFYNELYKSEFEREEYLIKQYESKNRLVDKKLKASSRK